VIIYMRKLAL